MSLFGDIKNAINPSRIDDLKSSISKHSGFNSGNRFTVIITPPNQTLLNINPQDIAISALSGGFKFGNLVNDPRDISILCEACTLPGRNIDTMDYDSSTNWQNRRKIPYGYSMGENSINFSFYVTNDFYIRKIFDRWQDLIVNRQTNLVAYDSDFKRDTIIQVLNRQGLPVYAIKLLGSFPTTISELELNNDAEAPLRLTVSMTYDTYEVQKPISSLVGGIKAAAGSVLRKLI